jgi:hypothetical protein
MKHTRRPLKSTLITTATKASEIDTYYYRYENETNGNVLHGSHVETVPGGTLEQRIQRTAF